MIALFLRAARRVHGAGFRVGSEEGDPQRGEGVPRGRHPGGPAAHLRRAGAKVAPVFPWHHPTLQRGT